MSPKTAVIRVQPTHQPIQSTSGRGFSSGSLVPKNPQTTKKTKNDKLRKLRERIPSECKVTLSRELFSDAT